LTEEPQISLHQRIIPKFDSPKRETANARKNSALELV
jgi:hypothetical protein